MFAGKQGIAIGTAPPETVTTAGGAGSPATWRPLAATVGGATVLTVYPQELRMGSEQASSRSPERMLLILSLFSVYVFC